MNYLAMFEVVFGEYYTAYYATISAESSQEAKRKAASYLGEFFGDSTARDGNYYFSKGQEVSARLMQLRRLSNARELVRLLKI